MDLYSVKPVYFISFQIQSYSGKLIAGKDQLRSLKFFAWTQHHKIAKYNFVEIYQLELSYQF